MLYTFVIICVLCLFTLQAEKALRNFYLSGRYKKQEKSIEDFIEGLG